MAASADDNGGSTLTLRLLSMGVIAVVSLLGCALPAALHYAHHGRTGAKDDKLLARVPIFSLLKAFAAGIILGVGFVHVLPDANDMLTEAVGGGYPWAHVMALTGMLLIVGVNQGMELLFRRVYKLGFDPYGHGHGHSHSHSHDHGHDQHAGARAEEGRGLLSSQQGGGSNGAAAAGVAVEESHPLPESSPDRHSHSHSHSSRNGHRRHLDGDEEAGSSCSGYGSLGGNDAPAQKAPHAPSSYKDGCHQSLLTEGEGEGEEDAVVVAARHCYHHDEVAHIVTAFQQQNHSLLTAAMMEMGIVLHSVLIGLGLGVLTTRWDTVLNLLIAISVHQFFEGMGLAIVILEAAASLPRRRIAVLFLVFALTTPAGVGLGILLSSSPTRAASATHSKGALLLEGGLNGLAAGVLISMGLQDMLVAELHQCKAQGNPWLQAAMLLAALCGSVVMDVLAVWA